MQSNRALKALILVGVWTYAAATWASISHHLFGLPDVVPAAALLSAIGAAAWSFRPRASVPSVERTGQSPQATALK